MIRIVVFGRVQGVFFRKTTQTAAKNLGFTGTVRNLDDGSVEITLDGEEKDGQLLLEKIQKMQGSHQIERVSIKPIEKERFTSFMIL